MNYVTAATLKNVTTNQRGQGLSSPTGWPIRLSFDTSATFLSNFCALAPQLLRENFALLFVVSTLNAHGTTAKATTLIIRYSKKKKKARELREKSNKLNPEPKFPPTPPEPKRRAELSTQTAPPEPAPEGEEDPEGEGGESTEEPEA